MGAWGAKENNYIIYYILCTVLCRGGGTEISAALCWLFPFFSRSSGFPPRLGREDLQDPGPLAGQGPVLREQRDVQSNTKHSEDDEAEEPGDTSTQRSSFVP